MKIKFLMAFATIALLLSFVFGFEIKESKADDVIHVSYAGGTNLLDPNNLEANQTRYSTIDPIYLPSTSGSLFFQICFSWARPSDPDNVTVEFFDIDMVSIGTFCAGDGFSSWGGDNNYYGCIMLEDIPDNAFAFQMRDLSDIDEELLQEGGKIMIFLGDEMLDEFEDFYPHVGVFDLSKEDVPVIEVSYDAPLSLDDIKEMIDCSDGYLGDVKRSLVVEAQDYLDNSNRIGTYRIVARVTDGRNHIDGEFYLKVVDKEFPTITGPDKINFAVGEEINDASIQNYFTVYDGYDNLTPQDIEILTEYPKQVYLVSLKVITLRISDSSGNTVEKDVSLFYADVDAPTIEGPDTITINYQLRTTVENIIRNQVTVTDTLDKTPVLTVDTDEYTGNERRIGTYNVTISARDFSGNVTTKDIVINVEDNIAPVIYLNSYKIDVTSSVNLSKLDFENLAFLQSTRYRTKNYTSKVLVDTYTGHESEPGLYKYKLLITLEDGEEIEKEFLVNVGENLYIIDQSAVKQISYKSESLLIVAASVLSLLAIMVVIGVRSKKLTKLIQ